MVETYLIKHNGSLPHYMDEVMFYTSSGMYITFIDGKSYKDNMSEEERQHINEFKAKVRILFKSEFKEASFNTLCEVVDNLANSDDNYIILHIEENRIESHLKGASRIKLISDGKINILPNGVFYLKETDSLIMATKYFYSLVADEGILVDALLSENCAQWSKFMINRISDINHLECANISCCTIRYKKPVNNQ